MHAAKLEGLWKAKVSAGWMDGEATFSFGYYLP